MEHMGFLRALGAKLLLDPASADDAVQSTLAVGLEQGPRDPGRARGWLARVFRNSAYQAHRAGRRRQRREREARHPTSVESTADAVARHEVLRHLAAAVSSLREPYRETVLLRFFDGLPPRKIAERMGAPVATVKSRLARAMNQLRAHLDSRASGGAATWRLAFAPLAGIGPASMGKASAGVAAMKMKTTGLVAAAAVLAIGGGVLILDPFAAPTEVDPGKESMTATAVGDAAGTPNPPEAPGPEPALTASADGTTPPSPDESVGDATDDSPEPDATSRSEPGSGVASNHANASRTDQKVRSLRLDDTSIADALASLKVMTGVNIVVSEQAAEAMKQKMSMQFSETPLKDILDTLTRFTDCSWSERSGVVFVTK